MLDRQEYAPDCAKYRKRTWSSLMVQNIGKEVGHYNMVRLANLGKLIHRGLNKKNLGFNRIKSRWQLNLPKWASFWQFELTILLRAAQYFLSSALMATPSMGPTTLPDLQWLTDIPTIIANRKTNPVKENRNSQLAPPEIAMGAKLPNSLLRILYKMQKSLRSLLKLHLGRDSTGLSDNKNFNRTHIKPPISPPKNIIILPQGSDNGDCNPS